MPSCRVTNNTSHDLNICLKQVTALHFENTVKPGQTIKLRPGKVWFTLEAVLDDGTKKTRYSILKSAATIALLSIAIGAVAATAGAALLPEALALEAVAVGGILAKGVAATKSALVSNSGTIAKISSVALPKAINRLSAEVGGLTALQREVLSIISSPTLSSDVRHRATALLRSVHSAYKNDKASRVASQTQTPTSITEEEDARKLDEAIDSGDLDDMVENKAVRTGETLRVHGIYMKERREFEVRVGEGGRLELWDIKTKLAVT
ncbi:hypothetical protein CI109_101167 [Kwoniella shandongensis]|uniref:Uncharacterized protein n=1 Tax=Kwoniella shandongensis TaxID=1734106 RepID=A0A5M6CAW1_9TREE|nr:uncharacterized protein CI109_001636 [Kwoniella shandongensis]KAA5530229.1 hypothetical protein CI109_001636 [Kwoniella shandongensis]